MIIMRIRAFSSIVANSRPTFFSSSHPSIPVPAPAPATVPVPVRLHNSALHLSSHTRSGNNSVTGVVYDLGPDDTAKNPIVQLYTKEGCTLCDKVSDVLKLLRKDHPHSLEAVDITDDDKVDVYDKYKYDIPVLHIDGKYWTKHRLDPEDAITALTQARKGEFEKQFNEPNASEMERRMAERNAQE